MASILPRLRRPRLSCLPAAATARFLGGGATAPMVLSSSNQEMIRLAREGDASSARKLFDAMPQKNLLAWNLMLAAYSKNAGFLAAAQELFFSIPSPDVVSFNTMLSCYFRNGAVEEAQRLFSAMPEKNLVSWNAMISGLILSGELPLAELYFRRAPDQEDVVLKTAMITGYMAAGRVSRAEALFDGMPAKNPVTWNAMISGYINNQQPENAMKIFRVAIGERIPNSSTLSSALLGCSRLSALDLGAQIHQLARKLPLILDPAVGTSLLSMYSKCGELRAARRLFDEMPRRDVISWNAMISGHALHGGAADALNLFDEMLSRKIPPNWITFAGALTACAHSGELAAGRRIFRSMQEEHGVEPRPDHYFPMVDLLCRSGLLAEAAELIHSSPFPPHSALFGALLGACRAGKNPELAQFAAGKLLELNPRSAGAYVQLANVYAAAGRWEEVAKVRKTMRDGKLVKAPGCSWVRAGGEVHVFRSGDRVHPELRRIWEKLGELEAAMKKAGYTPDLGSSGKDLAEEEQERVLLRHSEKLAIAYALMVVPGWKTIRVFKNLRVCVDCHKATKLISRIEGREIIVRDTARFHHFRDGSCSCGDFW